MWNLARMLLAALISGIAWIAVFTLITVHTAAYLYPYVMIFKAVF